MIKHTGNLEETEVDESEAHAHSWHFLSPDCVPVTMLSAGPVLNHSHPWVSAGERLQDPLRIPESADARLP